jgi:hypothetical protein
VTDADDPVAYVMHSVLTGRTATTVVDGDRQYLTGEDLPRRRENDGASADSPQPGPR